jgi:hypothetical protein
MTAFKTTDDLGNINGSRNKGKNQSMVMQSKVSTNVTANQQNHSYIGPTSTRTGPHMPTNGRNNDSTFLPSIQSNHGLSQPPVRPGVSTQVQNKQILKKFLRSSFNSKSPFKGYEEVSNET